MTDIYFQCGKLINPWCGPIVASTQPLEPLAKQYRSVLIDTRAVSFEEVKFDENGIITDNSSLAGMCLEGIRYLANSTLLSTTVQLAQIDNIAYLRPHVANARLSEMMYAAKAEHNVYRGLMIEFMPYNVIRKAARTAQADIAFVQLQNNFSALDCLLAKTSHVVLNASQAFQVVVKQYNILRYPNCQPWCKLESSKFVDTMDPQGEIEQLINEFHQAQEYAAAFKDHLSNPTYMNYKAILEFRGQCKHYKRYDMDYNFCDFQLEHFAQLQKEKKKYLQIYKDTYVQKLARISAFKLSLQNQFQLKCDDQGNFDSQTPHAIPPLFQNKQEFDYALTTQLNKYKEARDFSALREERNDLVLKFGLETVEHFERVHKINVFQY